MGYLKLIVVGLIALLLTSCSSLWNIGGESRSGVSSSLVDYLYPSGEVPPNVQASIPLLELPLRVGIAFVPGESGRSTISEPTKIELWRWSKPNSSTGNSLSTSR